MSLSLRVFHRVQCKTKKNILIDALNMISNQGCHLAFLKLFARNKMVWPFGHFLAFFNVDKNSIFLGML